MPATISAIGESKQLASNITDDVAIAVVTNLARTKVSKTAAEFGVAARIVLNCRLKKRKIGVVTARAQAYCPTNVAEPSRARTINMQS
jgi:hypothetical protein